MALSQDVSGDSEEFLLALALRRGRRPAGFLRLVPGYGADFGYTLDLMRHDPDAPNGMTEFLIVRRPRSWGARGRAAVDELRGVGPAVHAEADLGPADRAMKWVVSR